MKENRNVSEIINANVEVHTRMAKTYNENEPHFRPENQAKVRKILETLNPSSGKGRMLDLGCGTGFMINLAKDLYSKIDGVDVTQAMLDRVDISSGNITLHNTVVENLPFESNSFDLVTAYSFLHHLEDYKLVLKEAYRVLKTGGILYIDLEPNRLFWQQMVGLDKSSGKNYSDIVKKEIKSVLYVAEEVEKNWKINKDIFRKAEYIKEYMGGIEPSQFERETNQIGFRQCNTRFEWFLGQGTILHGQSLEASETVDAYLRDVLPLSQHLYKYLQFILKK